MPANYNVIDVAGNERYDGDSLREAMDIFMDIQQAEIEGRIDDEGNLITDMDCGYGSSLAIGDHELLSGACKLSGCWDCSVMDVSIVETESVRIPALIDNSLRITS